MSKFGAKDAFSRLAEAYLSVCKSEESRIFVRDLRADHNYHLDDYYFSKETRDHSKKALKNDLKGALRNER